MDIKEAIAEVVKKYLSAPQQSASVKANQKVMLKNWKKEEDRQKYIQHTVELNQGQLNSDVERIILQMRVGDIWQVKVTSPLQKQAQFYMEVVSACDVDREGLKSPFSQAEKAKAEGNSCIKEKSYEKAIDSYEKAFSILEYLCDSESVELKLSVISNLALATLNLGRFRQCLEWCQKYIKESLDCNKKVIYRQASAQKGLRDWESARKTIRQALEYWKGDKDTQGDFKQLGDMIEKEEKAQVAKQKKVYANMFG